VITGGNVRGGLRGALLGSVMGLTLAHDGLVANFIGGQFYTKVAGQSATQFADPQSMFSWNAGAGSPKMVRQANGNLGWSPHNGAVSTRTFEASGNLVYLNVTRSSTTELAPDGTNTATLFLETTATGVHRIQIAGFTGSLATGFGNRIYVKKYGTRRYFSLQNSASGGRWNFDLDLGTVDAGAGGGVTATIEPAGGGWYLCTINTTSPAGAGGAFFACVGTVAGVPPAGGESYTGSTSEGVLLWRPQSYNGLTPQPYIENTANTPYYGPAYEYDFNTNLLGVRVEAASKINYCLRSDDLGVTWTSINASRETNVATSPDGTTNADRFRGVASSTAQGVQQGAITVPLNAQLTASVWLKYETNQFVTFGIFDSAWRQANFDLINGVVNATAAGVTATIERWKDNWYRCTVTYTISGTSAFVGAFLSDVSTNTVPEIYNAGTSATCLFYGAQLEQGAFASSYIPTTTASVTRNADVIFRTTGAEASATAMTIFAEAIPITNGTLYSADLVSWAATASPLNNTISLYVFQADMGANIRSGAASQYNPTGTALASGNLGRWAVATELNNMRLASQGNLAVLDTSCVMPVGADRLRLCESVATAAGDYWLRKIEFWPSRLSDLTIQGMTVL
jgi:hypothetical protein